jgi:hypothetical protein
MRTSILAALLVAAFTLPAAAAPHPVKGAVHGTATAAKGVGHGAVQAGRGMPGHGDCSAERGQRRSLPLYARHSLLALLATTLG